MCQMAQATESCKGERRSNQLKSADCRLNPPKLPSTLRKTSKVNNTKDQNHSP